MPRATVVVSCNSSGQSDYFREVIAMMRGSFLPEDGGKKSSLSYFVGMQPY